MIECLGVPSNILPTPLSNEGPYILCNAPPPSSSIESMPRLSL